MSIQEQIERLAIEQAVYKAIGADVATNDPGNLRAEVNAYYHDLYEQTGPRASRFASTARKSARTALPRFAARRRAPSAS